MKWKVAGALVTTLAIGAAGCGGSSSKPASQAGFATRADAVCTRLNAQNLALMKAEGRRAGQNDVSQGDLLAQVLPKLRAQQQQAIAALDALTPPDNLKPTYSRWMNAQRRVFTLLPTAADLRAGSDPELHERKVQLATQSRLSKGLGLKDCR